MRNDLVMGSAAPQGEPAICGAWRRKGMEEVVRRESHQVHQDISNSWLYANNWRASTAPTGLESMAGLTAGSVEGSHDGQPEETMPGSHWG